jgi:hypothetical protein
LTQDVAVGLVRLYGSNLFNLARRHSLFQFHIQSEFASLREVVLIDNAKVVRKLDSHLVIMQTNQTLIGYFLYDDPIGTFVPRKRIGIDALLNLIVNIEDY